MKMYKYEKIRSSEDDLLVYSLDYLSTLNILVLKPLSGHLKFYRMKTSFKRFISVVGGPLFQICDVISVRQKSF